MKKYRVFKGGGQQMNPTAMWFAQMGAQQPSQEEMMMMQQQQQQGSPQGGGEDQLGQLVQKMGEALQQGADPQEVAGQLLQGQVPPELIMEAFIELGMPQDKAQEIVMTVAQQMQGGQEQGQPSEEEMMAMQQQQMAQGPEGQAPMARNGYIKKRLKMAQDGMANESGSASDTNLIANKNIQKNDLLSFTQQNVAANQFGQEYDQMYNGGGLEQARYGRGKARRAARRDAGNADQGDNFAKNQGMRSRQLARRAVKEMPGIYSRGDKRALREGLESGEFDKYDVYQGVDVFSPQTKSGYPDIATGEWNPTMIPGNQWAKGSPTDDMIGTDEVIEETSVEENVITDNDSSWDYKKENGVLYTRKKGTDKWIKVDPNSSAGISIRKNVYGEDIEGSEDMQEPAMEDEETYEVDENENAEIGNDGQPCLEYPGEGSGQTFSEWAAGLPYDEFGMYTSNCGETFNSTELPGYNKKNIEARIPFEFGGEQDLEMARFGRGRARRQERRAGRQGRRALGQMDRAMRGAYGNIAFPAGASPMMAGMPMMGTQGAMSPRMHFEGERGLFGRLKNFKMDIDGMGMPMNFSRGMFMNGIFNPYGQQGGYNDTAYKISYPGTTGPKDEVKAVDDKDKTNEEIAKELPGSTDKDKTNKEDSEVNDETGNEGECSTGQEKYMGECLPICGSDYERDMETGDCVPKKSSGENGESEIEGACDTPQGLKLSKLSKDDADEICEADKGKGFSFNESLCKCLYLDDTGFWSNYGPVLGVAGGVLAITYGKKIFSIPKNATKAVKSRFAKIKAAKAAKASAAEINKLVNAGGIKVEVAPKAGGTPGAFADKFKKASKFKYSVPSGASTTIKNTVARIPVPALAGPPVKPGNVSFNSKVGTPVNINSTPIGSGNTPLLTEAEAMASRNINRPTMLTASEQSLFKSELAVAEKKSAQALRELAKKYGVNVAKNAGKKAIVSYLKNLFLKIITKKTGGAIDAMDENYGNPDLYRFTGGGDPGFVDYFADGGYYEDGDPPLQPTTVSYLDKQFPGTGLRKELEKVPNMGRAAGSLSGVNQFLTNSDYKNSRVDDVAVYDFLPFAGGTPESVEAGNRAMIENRIRESGEDIEGHPYYNQSDVDYFDEDYDVYGMAYGGSAQPQYKNVYDPYMPMAGNGMTMVNRPYQTAAEYGNEYAPYPGPYAEPMVTDSIRNSVIDSRRLIDGITDEEIERSTVRQQYGGYQEGDEVYMTGGELAQYLAGGGQVEFID